MSVVCAILDAGTVKPPELSWMMAAFALLTVAGLALSRWRRGIGFAVFAVLVAYSAFTVWKIRQLPLGVGVHSESGWKFVVILAVGSLAVLSAIAMGVLLRRRVTREKKSG